MAFIFLSSRMCIRPHPLMRASSFHPRWWRVVALTTLLSASPVLAQGAGWRFAAPEGARAWFAVMAGARVEGVGPLPYYRTMLAAVVVPDSVRRSVAKDASFEVLHFLPLYLPNGDARLVAGALRAAASGRELPVGNPAAFATAALRSVLPRDDQRATLAALAGAVERAAASLPDAPAVSALQRRWDAAFAPRLAPYLSAQRLDGGIVLVAEALGPEGRIFAGRPDDATDNIIAVTAASARATTTDATLFAVVRELCFPLVTRLASYDRSSATSRDEQAVRASLAAVRCGERLTARALPELAAEYRRQWLILAGRTPSTDPAAFQEAFPVDLSFDQAIVAELSRTFPSRSTGRSSP